jgi:hypothetical protein
MKNGSILFIVILGIIIAIVVLNPIEKTNSTDNNQTKIILKAVQSTSGGGGGGSSSNIEIKAASPPPSNTHSDKIKAFYTYESITPSQLDYAIDRGVNTFIIKYGYLSTPNSQVINVVNYLNDKDVLVIPAISVNYAPDYDITAKALYYNEDTKTMIEGNSVPVLNRAYWNKITDKAKSLAQTSGVDGVFLDFELYLDYPSAPFYYSYLGSYDTETFSEFVTANNLQSLNPPVSESEKLNRYTWIKNNNLQNEYILFIREKAKSLAKNFEQQVHSVNPNFIISSYPSAFWSDSRSRYVNPLFFDFYEGWNNSWLFSSDTYGYNSIGVLPSEFTVKNSKSYLIRRDTKQEYQIKFIPGELLRYYTPEKFNLISDMASKTDGYWLFTSYSLYTPCSQSKDYYRLPVNCGTDLNNPGCCINQWSTTDTYWNTNCCSNYPAQIENYWTAISKLNSDLNSNGFSSVNVSNLLSKANMGYIVIFIILIVLIKSANKSR